MTNETITELRARLQHEYDTKFRPRLKAIIAKQQRIEYDYLTELEDRNLDLSHLK